ncbi:hypothetical protein FJ872_32310 [Mesorhizobium sp. B2-5-9]|uniref:DUF6212 domain-containing protein n=1 Tax=Mesorhizobium sp. B2-5-9 TaxID=2589921 RepID=UPI0011261E34|nr:DUF6212 domain-containing protein [Mesorhizobium sp. B2-5-9]TPJ96775.1 hypothetical protein FJ872_32310 [Mesorhizobium sp. B2-5-9]
MTDLGIPVALEMIVAPPGCLTARELLELMKSSGFPRPVPLVELAPAGWIRKKVSGLDIMTAYQKALEATLSAVQTHAHKRESEIVALRRRVEAQTLTNNHTLGFLDMLGYSAQELALEQIPDLAMDFLTPPFKQRLPMLLSDVSGVSIYSSRSDATQRITISIEIGDTQIHREGLMLSGEGGWSDLFFPHGFLQNNQDATLIVEAIDGNPSFATAKGIADTRSGFFGAGGRSAALRIWRNADSRVHPLQTAPSLQLPRPTVIDGNVLGQVAILEALESKRIEDAIALRTDCFVQTHPVRDEISNYVVRDIDLGLVESIEAMVSLDHPKATPVRFILLLVPEQNDADLYACLLKTVKEAIRIDNSRLAHVTLPKAETNVLTISTAGIDRRLRYCLVLAADSGKPNPKYAWAKWRYVTFGMRTKPQRQTYRFSALSALANQLQYADGPVAENEMNQKMGFPVLAVADGDRYLQTHPVENHVVAARLDSFVPKGTQRFWIEVSNDHEHASPTEFGVLVTPTIIAEPFNLHYDTSGYLNLADNRVHEVGAGAYLKKLVLRAREKACIDVFLTAPLTENAHLYLFVKTRSGSTQYGWCRWHRLAMTILAGTD